MALLGHVHTCMPMHIECAECVRCVCVCVCYVECEYARGAHKSQNGSGWCSSGLHARIKAGRSAGQWRDRKMQPQPMRPVPTPEGGSAIRISSGLKWRLYAPGIQRMSSLTITFTTPTEIQGSVYTYGMRADPC